MAPISQSEPFSIRAARDSDTPLILTLVRALASYENRPSAAVADETTLRRWLFESERPVAKVLLGFCGEEAVGFCLYFYNFSSFLGEPGIYIEDLFVCENARGKGYGKAFISELATRAFEEGLSRIELSVLKNNNAGIEFYKSLGAELSTAWAGQRISGDSFNRLIRQ